jgi:bifunctional non-homologous end joining protein LigD
VIIWDKGTWRPLEDPHKALKAGNLKFEIEGHKMHGRWVLVRMKGKGEKQEPWLLIKEKDEYARPAEEFSLVDEMPDSVKALPMPAAVAAEAKADERAAPKVSMPESLTPQLATLVDAPPVHAEDWLFEVKFDGYRLLARIEGKDIRLFTRNGNDWTHKLKPLHDQLAKLKLPAGWYDGEIVVHDESGRPDFGLLQNAFDENAPGEMVYFIFDLPFHNGHDLREMPLQERRAILEQVLEKRHSENVRFSASLDAAPQDMIAAACQMGLEGIIGKRRDAVYSARRSGAWIKLKCGQRQEFVIGGYTDPQGSRSGFGSLLLGTYDQQGKLQYAGNVGSGFNATSLKELKAKMERLHVDKSPFAPSREIDKKAHWLKPTLVAEVSFGEWTRSGSIRHSVFKGLRKDKKAESIVREQAAHVKEEPQMEAAVQGNLPKSLKVTNPDRVIDKQSGATKMTLIRYYALVAGLMIPHLKGRPVSLVRAPEGVGGELFFQKHAEVSRMPGMKQFRKELDPDHPPMLEVPNEEALLSAAQMNVVELHTQNASGSSYEKPNRMIFDLDPGEGVTWEQVREGAQLMGAFLQELALPAFVKTSGGKGLHVVVPIKPGYGWDDVKDFSQAIVAHMSQTIPERFVLKSGPRNRVGKIFIDFLRNGRGATTVAAWSARTRPGLGISVPISWEELDDLDGADHWNVNNVHTRLDVGNTPWDDYAKSAKGLAAAMKLMQFKPGRS